MTTDQAAHEAGRVRRPAIIKVWDPFVRLFHWSLVAGIAYEFLTEAGTDSHEVIGYLAISLIGLRLVWGVAGPKHARFSDFVKSPLAVLAYVKSIIAGHPKRYLGHNPAGGAMVIALIVAVAGTGLSGWAMTTDALWGQSWIENLHEALANSLLFLVPAHVIGVIAASFQHRENLLRSMVTGWKKL